MSAKDYTKTDLEISKGRRDWYFKKISEILAEENIISDPRQLRINMGVESEFFKVFESEIDAKDEESSYKRRHQQVKENPEYYYKTKGEEHIPAPSKSEFLDTLFSGNKRALYPENREKNRTTVTVEPALLGGTETLTRLEMSKKLGSQQLSLYHAAYSQGEIISPILTYKSAGGWMEKIPNTVVKESKKYLIDRVDFNSKTDGMNLLPNSIHMNISVSYVKKEDLYKPYLERLENSTNLLSQEGFRESANEDAKKLPSQIALAIGFFRNKFVNEAFLMYAPTKKAYSRFDENDIAAPKHMGFFPQRKLGEFGGIAFRGAGIRFSRPEDNTKSADKGPLRIEERIICPEAMGHPNRDTYPDQALMAHELVEMQMYILYKGVKNWQKNKRDGVTLKYEELLNQQPTIPEDLTNAFNRFNNSNLVKEFLSQSLMEDMNFDIPKNEGRLSRVIERHGRLQKILRKDNYIGTPNRGPGYEREL